MKQNNYKLYLGVHLDNNHYSSIVDALIKVKKLGGNVVQIYLGSKYLTTLREKILLTKDEMNEIKSYLKEYDIKLFVHSILRLNYCRDPFLKKNEWGINNLVYDMDLCYKIGGEGVVLHLGTYKTDKIDISYEEGVENFITSLKIVLNQTTKIPIILETPVNRKNIIGGTIEKLANLYNNIPDNCIKRVKICIDTQHIFVSGYNIRSKIEIKNYLNNFDKLIGIKNLVLIHLNDSKKIFNSKIDRHSPIGEGFIFEKKNASSLNYLIKFSNSKKIPLLMETSYESYKYELKYIKKILENNQKGGTKKNIKKLILKIFKEILFFHESLGKKGNISTKFRIDSYIKAIKSIEKFKNPIYNSNNVKNLEFIGKGFCEKIDFISKNGTLKIYENIKKNNTINSIKLFQKIWGIGPEQSRLIVNNNIFTIKELKKAVKNKNINLSEKQLIGLKYYNDLNKKISREEITYYTNIIKELIENTNIKIYNAGSYRYGKKFSGDIDLIISYKEYDINKIKELFINTLKNKNIIADTLSYGIQKSIFVVKIQKKNNNYNYKKNVNIKYYRKIDIAFVKEKHLPWYLLYFGSSRDFSKKIRNIALKKGYKLNEKGIYNRNSGERINFFPINEEDIFKYLNIEYILPKDRI
jgi:apurinic endonuclease APN1